MISTYAEIKIKEVAGQTISGVTCNIAGNNASSDISSLLNVARAGSNPFYFGASQLNSGAVYDMNVSKGGNIDYFIGSIPANDLGLFPTPYEITITGENITQFTIIFDKYNKRFPNAIEVDGQVFSGLDAEFAIVVAASNSHTIVIREYVPKYPLVIQGIYSDFRIIVNRRNFVSISYNSADRGDDSKPKYGVISNSGMLEFLDDEGLVDACAYNDLLDSNNEIYVYLYNDILKTMKLQGIYEGSNWEYDNTTRKVKVNLQDFILGLQDITVGDVALIDTSTINNIFKYYRALDMFNLLNEYAPDKLKVYAKSEATAWLQKVGIKYPYLSSGTLWSQWQKLCEICGAHIYTERDGKIYITVDKEVYENE